MKITIFGGTGATGQLIVQQALDAGHEVTVYARNPQKLSVRHERLSLVKGELSESGAITKSIAGREAVISVLGPTAGAKGTPVTDGTKSIITAMKHHGVSRLIVTSTPSLADPLDRFSLSFRLAVGLIRALQRAAYDDIVGAGEAVRSSGLSWTIVRLPMLTNKVSEPPPVAGYLGTPGLRLFSLSRTVLADFLVKQLSDQSWINRAPVVSNRL